MRPLTGFLLGTSSKCYSIWENNVEINGATAQEPDASITPRRRGRRPDLIQQSEVQCLQAQRSKILRGEILTLMTC